MRLIVSDPRGDYHLTQNPISLQPRIVRRANSSLRTCLESYRDLWTRGKCHNKYPIVIPITTMHRDPHTRPRCNMTGGENFS
ncbi:hypothetical protein COCCADRAFT_108236 [Bipolaris zeicola 26-R-13]|uniref:Uncharacterized protein n=1 Tax=Cochliobolus carbonum (strain 26-R-13) TaxID=930089 RepID=W6Y1B1_COCC2|nr:uncharacterized protein COCCADRAFT_108236 [Bipolaris zeicola 26-R-13]EUC28794.1 hypothetical protein COCCADRAFT_108236 [Bipolaris zeicola 26-R-13]